VQKVMSAISSTGSIDRPLPVKDTLFFKIQGGADCIERTSKAVQTIVKKHGSSHFVFAATDNEAESLWQSRKYALMATLSTYPNSRCWTTDVWYAPSFPVR
jgi:D-lactate dehydrogenase (cytochrome)